MIACIYRFLVVYCLGCGYCMGITIYPAEPELTPVVVPDANGNAHEAEPGTPVILQIDIPRFVLRDAYERLMDELAQARNGSLRDYKLAGILLTVSGEVGFIGYASLMADTIRQFADMLHIPIYSFIDSDCFFAGYAIASAAEAIYMSDSASIGEFGHIKHFFDYRQNVQILAELPENALALAFDPDSEFLFKGIDKGVGFPYRPWDETTFDNEAALYQEFYHIFVDTVSQRRPQLTPELLIDQIGAKIFPASEAVSLGLADKAGQSRETTLKDLSEAAGVASNYNVITFVKP